MIGGAIFDADGTLLDSMKIWEEAGTKYLLKLGLRPESDLSEVLFSMSLEEGSLYLKTYYNLTETLEEIKAGVLSIITDFFKLEVQAKKGTAMFLQKLQQNKIPMVIATSGDSLLLDSALKRLNIRSYFKYIFTCSELGTTKREPFIYQEAARSLNADIDNIFVFEDVLYALNTASSLGFKTVAVEDRASAIDKDQIIMAADYYMADFSDFEGFWKFASNGFNNL